MPIAGRKTTTFFSRMDERKDDCAEGLDWSWMGTREAGSGEMSDGIRLVMMARGVSNGAWSEADGRVAAEAEARASKGAGRGRARSETTEVMVGS